MTQQPGEFHSDPIDREHFNLHTDVLELLSPRYYHGDLSVEDLRVQATPVVGLLALLRTGGIDRTGQPVIAEYTSQRDMTDPSHSAFTYEGLYQDQLARQIATDAKYGYHLNIAIEPERSIWKIVPEPERSGSWLRYVAHQARRLREKDTVTNEPEEIEPDFRLKIAHTVDEHSYGRDRGKETFSYHRWRHRIQLVYPRRQQS